MSFLIPTKSLRAEIESCITQVSVVFDRLIDFHSTHPSGRLLQGTWPFGANNGGLGQRSIKTEFVFSMSHPS